LKQFCSMFVIELNDKSTILKLFNLRNVNDKIALILL
jgi:hypothetical protein